MFSWISFYYSFVHVMIISWSKVLEMKLFSSIQSLSRVQLFATAWTAEPGFPAHHQLPEPTQLTSIVSVLPPNHLILCHPLPLPPSIFPSIRVFQISHLFTSGDQSIGVSASASVLPMNIQDWFPLELTGLILQSKRLSIVFSNTTVQKHQFFNIQLSL